jgi:hypothetical protein
MNIVMLAWFGFVIWMTQFWVWMISFSLVIISLSRCYVYISCQDAFYIARHLAAELETNLAVSI